MLQALLADRFKLRVHHETQEGNVSHLRLRKRIRLWGSNFGDLRAVALRHHRSDAVSGSAAGLVSFTGAPMAQLIGLLPRFVDRMVVDATGLTSPLDSTLSWTPEAGEWVAPPMPGTPPVPPRDGPSLFTALQEQLALKLESQRGPIDVLIIESADRPSEN
jgi:uncharacterized protein (TIGR03435 family)